MSARDVRYITSYSVITDMYVGEANTTSLVA